MLSVFPSSFVPCRVVLGAKAGVFAAVLAGFAVSGSVAHAQAEGLVARYSVNLMGFSLGDATLTGKFGPDAYSVQAYAKLSGLAQAVTGAKGAARSSGGIRNGKLAPSGYATTSSNSRETRTVRMGMAAGNVRAVHISPPIPDRPGRVPLNASHQRNIIDPLSALVFPAAANAALDGQSACNRRLPVFDGYTRFDVTLRYAGTRMVNAKGYRGQVFVCKARYTPIAGHRPDRQATKFMVSNNKMEVWLAPMQKAHAFAPFRIAVNTMAGMLEIKARSFVMAGEAPTATVTR
ncbi:MAG: DUF3108 domain-containing protein [Beijerinckiaceae bacterium]